MKKITLKLFLLLFFSATAMSFAQEKQKKQEKHFTQELTNANKMSLEETGFIRCMTVENEVDLQNKYPERAKDQDFENWLRPKAEQIKQQIASGTFRGTNNVIPVIFHVFTDGAGGDNLSQEAIQAQLDQLNIDYADLAGSSYDVSADAQLQFCLAQMDASGVPVDEPGINRITTYGDGPFARSTFESTMKAATQWDPEQFLNVWVANLSGGLLGYAQFPSSSGLPGLNTNGGQASTDGVVIASNSVGSVASPNPLGHPYNKGRTLTHELGHWLGLRHIWGDNWGQGDPDNASCNVDDFCADTPNAGKPHFGCETGADTCPTDPNNDMVENYMDYSDDACMHTFTADQVTRILAVMANSPRRVNLLTSNVCTASPVIAVSSTIPANISEGNECGYQDVEIVLSIGTPASENATVSLIASGSATENVDFELINNSVTFTAGSTTPSNNITLRVYEDGVVEADEIISLTVDVTTTGDAVATGLIYTTTIVNDDQPIGSSGTTEVFSDGFETYSDFDITPIGGWTMLDVDQSTTYAITNTTFPNANYTGSFIVFNPSQTTPPLDGTTMDPHTGSKGYYCFAATSAPNNDYIFTPQLNLNGTGSELKFWAKSYTAQYGLERFKIGVSTTDTAPGSFTFISASPYVQAPESWTEYTYDLSAYDGQQVYITFQCVSNDAFIFMLDDVLVTTNVSANVQTDVNTPTSSTVNQSGEAFFTDSNSGNIMLSIDNTGDFNYGCTDVSVSRDIATAGAAAVMYGSSTDPANFVTAKTFDITTAATNTSAGTTIDFYFTEAELAAWEAITGNSRNELYVRKESTNEIVATSLSAFDTDAVLSAEFTSGLDGTYVFGTQMALLSLSSFEMDSEISIYPNPTSHVLNIKSTNKNLPDAYAVYNMLGQVMMSKNISTEADLSIDTSSLSNGMYFIKITKESSQLSLPFIKK